MRIVATARYIDVRAKEQGTQVEEIPRRNQVQQRYIKPQPFSEMTGIRLTALPTPPEETSRVDRMDLVNLMPLEDATPTKTCRVPTMYRTMPDRPMSGLPPMSPILHQERRTYIDEADGTIYNEARAASEQPPTIASSGIVGEGTWMNRPTYCGWR